MKPNDIDAIKDQLQEQHATLSAQADEIRGELSRLDEDLARIDAALAVLSGTSIPSVSTKLTKRERKKPLPPAASKVHVLDLLLEELAQGNAVHEAELKSHVEQKLIESGYSRMGLSLRFKEAMSDERVRVAVNGVSLKPAKHLLTSQGSFHKGDEQVKA